MEEVIQQGNKKSIKPGMDTVVIMCLAIVQKSQYDASGVTNIVPAVVYGSDGKEIAQLPPVLFVGQSSQMREEIVQRIVGEFQRYENTKDKNKE